MLNIDGREHLIEQGPGRGLNDVKIVLECSLDCEHNLYAIVEMEAILHNLQPQAQAVNTDHAFSI